MSIKNKTDEIFRGKRYFVDYSEMFISLISLVIIVIYRESNYYSAVNPVLANNDYLALFRLTSNIHFSTLRHS